MVASLVPADEDAPGSESSLTSPGRRLRSKGVLERSRSCSTACWRSSSRREVRLGVGEEGDARGRRGGPDGDSGTGGLTIHSPHTRSSLSSRSRVDGEVVAEGNPRRRRRRRGACGFLWVVEITGLYLSDYFALPTQQNCRLSSRSTGRPSSSSIQVVSRLRAHSKLCGASYPPMLLTQPYLACLLATVAPVALALAQDVTPTFVREEGRCAMRDSCGRKSVFSGEIPCPDNGRATAVRPGFALHRNSC